MNKLFLTKKVICIIIFSAIGLVLLVIEIVAHILNIDIPGIGSLVILLSGIIAPLIMVIILINMVAKKIKSGENIKTSFKRDLPIVIACAVYTILIISTIH